MKVKLLRKWRKEAERKIFVQQFEDVFRVIIIKRGREEVLPSRLAPYFDKKEQAIYHCKHERRLYILRKIKRRVY